LTVIEERKHTQKVIDPLPFEIWIFRNGQPVYNDDRIFFVATTLTEEQQDTFVLTRVIIYHQPIPTSCFDLQLLIVIFRSLTAISWLPILLQGQSPYPLHTFEGNILTILMKSDQ
jgi:hypothetical protein